MTAQNNIIFNYWWQKTRLSGITYGACIIRNYANICSWRLSIE